MQPKNNRHSGRLISFALSFLLIFSRGSMLAAAEQTAYFNADIEHAPIAFSDMPYTGYDQERFDGMIEQVRELLATPNQSAELMERYDQLLIELDILETQYTLASIFYYLNAGDAYWQQEYMRLESIVQVEWDAVCLVAADLMRSGYSRAFSRHIGSENAALFRGYRALTEEELALSQRERELVQEYYTLLDEGFDNAWQANEVLGEKYLELRELRRKIALQNEVSDYAQFASDAYYARYLPREEMQALFERIKAEIAPVYHQMGKEYDPNAQWTLERYRMPDSEEQLRMVGRHIGDISWEMQQSWDYLMEYQLYDISSSPNKIEVGFTTDLPQYNSAFIFNHPYDNLFDLDTIIHEFGHFNYFYWEDTPGLYRFDNYDLMEIHSQGLEMLYLHYYPEMFARDIAEAKYYDQIYSMLGAIVDYACLAEFELAVYGADEELTIADLNRMYYSISREYGLEHFDDNSSEDIYWIGYDHVFSSPMYSLSYSVSGLAALNIWVKSLDDYEAAVDSYLRLVSAGTAYTFDDTLKNSGLDDIFSREFTLDLAQTIVEQFGLEPPPELLRSQSLIDQIGGLAENEFGWKSWMTVSVLLFPCGLILLAWQMSRRR